MGECFVQKVGNNELLTTELATWQCLAVMHVIKDLDDS